MEIVDIEDLKDDNESPEALLKKRKMFEERYNKQVEERENVKKLKQIENEQNKDPKELMLTIQANFCGLCDSK